MQTLVLPHTLHTSVAKILWKASTCKERHRTMAHDSALLHSLFLTSSLSSELPCTPNVCDNPLYLVKEQSHCKLTVLRLSNLLFSTHHTLLFSNLLKTPSSLDHPISPYPSTLCWLHFALPVQFSSVAQLYPTLCNPMDCSMPGLPVHYQLPEFTQTHVHWIGDAIQPSHPLSSPSPPTFNLSQHQGLFRWVSSSHLVAKVLEFQLQHQLQLCPLTNLNFMFYCFISFTYLFLAMLGLHCCTGPHFVQCMVFSSRWLLVLLVSTGSGSLRLRYLWLRKPSCPVARGIFPHQGPNPCSLLWQADFQPLD